MRNFIIALATLTLTTTGIWAQEEIDGGPVYVDFKPIYRVKNFIQVDSIYNGKLNEDEAIFHFDLQNLMPADTSAIVHFSMDSTEFLRPLKSGRLSVKTTPGYHSFQIYVNENYTEAFSPMLNIAGQTELIYQVILSHRLPEEPIITFKPVIYLYPEEATDIALSVDIHDGKHPFYYPKYKDEWKCTAQPNGTLTIEDEQYRYLFWEAEQADHLQEIDVNEGFVVAGTEAVSFLEAKLKEVGFTSEERADFITFWGPKLAANDQNLVRFEWNETCDKFADLNISPKPDHIYRFYIFMSALDGNIDLQPQILPQFERNGFVVLEWGGQISNYQPNTAL